MPVLITWNSSMLLNLPEVDAQHMEIVEKLNQVHDLIRARKARSAILREWNLLLELLRDHFATEERMMRRAKCPSLERHKSEHDYLLRMAGKIGMTPEATSLIREWMVTHLNGSDTQMAKELKAI